MALDQSAVLELIESLKEADVADRIWEAERIGLLTKSITVVRAPVGL